MAAPIPSTDRERVKNLHSYQILDTPAESDFDDITLMASQICGTPVSMVSFVDGDRQWFKSAAGTELKETPRDISFCGYTVAGRDLFVVQDARADARFSDNPLVTGDEQVRFYAGAPLVTPEGHAIGALCVVDNVPRQLDEKQEQALRALARQTVAQLKLRRTVAKLAQALADQQRAEKELAYLARHDALTGLPNRACFMEGLAQSVARARRNSNQPFAVLFLDLDRFKLINDSLGHAAGDKLLVAVAGRLMQCVRETDTVARLGGDEFTILLDGMHTAADAARLSERILASLAEPVDFNGQDISVTGSIGIVMNGASYATAADLLRDADIAMYRAKSGGRGRYTLFDAKMQQEAMMSLHMESDLRHAVERDELLLHYQPIMNLVTGRPVGFEALVRWSRGEGNLVSPADFIPIAEESGLILPIGEWVLREACRQLAAWQRAEPELEDIWMSVNLSRRQLADPELINVLRRVLDETGVNPSRLKLEITESLIIDDADHSAAETLAVVRALGVQVAMDDFGTGYSSLSCLHRFPIDMLKIDRAFIQHVASQRSAAVVEAIVDLAHALSIKVIAEGLETPEQVSLVSALECDEGQGYFFAKPLTAEKAAAFLRETSTAGSFPNRRRAISFARHTSAAA